MRIIGGEWRSRRLKSIPGDETRPTPDRLRETLFDILQTRIEGATFLDGYAGTGAVGIEALSRGARHVYFLERNRNAVEAIRANLASLGASGRATVVPGQVFKSLALHRAEIVFLDPPYELEKEYVASLELLGAPETEPRPSGSGASPLVIVQHSKWLKLAEAYGELRRTRVVRQGDNELSFYSAVG
jgi:16S rRNA (guanine(966)-N(2))-methyltransferase RsmD